jgi:hypothetical protein
MAAVAQILGLRDMSRGNGCHVLMRSLAMLKGSCLLPPPKQPEACMLRGLGGPTGHHLGLLLLSRPAASRGFSSNPGKTVNGKKSHHRWHLKQASAWQGN